MALVTLWTSGPDPSRDALFRLQALVREDGGGWRAFDLYVDDPRRSGLDQATKSSGEGVTRRVQRELGVSAQDLAGAPTPEAAWAALADFLGDTPLLVASRPAFEAWARHLDPEDEPFAARWRHTARVLALEEFHALLRPGAPRPAPDPTPEALLDGFAETLAALAQIPPAPLALVAHALARAAEALWARDREAAAVLTQALTLAEHPGWAARSEALFDSTLEDGLFSRALEAAPDLDEALRKARPRWHLPFAELEADPPLPPLKEGVGPLGPEDLARVDDIFGAYLPEHFGAAAPRDGQRALAGELARSLGKGEVLLAQAPTGTGKTLAYLVPLALWALRQGMRTGVATFTRALQDQAAEREVPLTLQLLSRAGVNEAPRIVRLKGRRNYLCWRALMRQVPLELTGDDEGEAPEPGRLIAWAALVAFGQASPDGDLDGFPVGLPLPFAGADLALIARKNLLRSVRAETSCCSSGRDRSTCASSVARRRAERAHVVIANHSFVLARQEFLRHVVFDECEHLHDQAKNAWSHSITTDGLRRELDAAFNLKAARGALAEAFEAAPEGSFIASCVEGALDRHGQARGVLDVLTRHLVDYDRWRAEAERGRDPRDRHGIFREYIENGPSAGLVTAHRNLVSTLAGLDAGLSSLLDHIDELPSKRRERIRDRLATRRTALLEAAQALDAWLPEDHEQATLQPRLSPAILYTASPDDEGWTGAVPGARPKSKRLPNERMAADVLLPHEELGRRYFPELESCALISATTMIGGSFQASARYLGLERLASPHPEEAREARDVRTFSVPEVFDYGRVLVGVPRDAPSVRDRDAYLAYFTRFCAHLARRTRGRVLCLFTNARDLAEVGRGLDEELVGSGIEVLAQGGELAKEELGERFRANPESVLLGVDTFWYGADFPGETLEYLLIARLPFGVPDDYHHAQIAAMGSSAQFKSVYLPRALARFRQGFGRLMRKESDKGCVFVLDKRVLEPRQRAFLKELPLATSDPALLHPQAKVATLQAELERKASTSPARGPEATVQADGPQANAEGPDSEASNTSTAPPTPGGARLVRGDSDAVLHAAFAHMEMLPDIARRGLDTPFAERKPEVTDLFASSLPLPSDQAPPEGDLFTPNLLADLGASAGLDDDPQSACNPPRKPKPRHKRSGGTTPPHKSRPKPFEPPEDPPF